MITSAIASAARRHRRQCCLELHRLPAWPLLPIIAARRVMISSIFIGSAMMFNTWHDDPE
jgi:hypothetical protein